MKYFFLNFAQYKCKPMLDFLHQLGVQKSIISFNGILHVLNYFHFEFHDLLHICVIYFEFISEIGLR